jgi:hypothetical protein
MRVYVALSEAFKGKAEIELKTIVPGVNGLSNVKVKKFGYYMMIFVTSVA